MQCILYVSGLRSGMSVCYILCRDQNINKKNLKKLIYVYKHCSNKKLEEMKEMKWRKWNNFQWINKSMTAIFLDQHFGSLLIKGEVRQIMEILRFSVNYESVGVRQFQWKNRQNLRLKIVFVSIILTYRCSIAYCKAQISFSG